MKALLGRVCCVCMVLQSLQTQVGAVNIFEKASSYSLPTRQDGINEPSETTREHSDTNIHIGGNTHASDVWLRGYSTILRQLDSFSRDGNTAVKREYSSDDNTEVNREDSQDDGISGKREYSQDDSTAVKRVYSQDDSTEVKREYSLNESTAVKRDYSPDVNTESSGLTDPSPLPSSVREPIVFTRPSQDSLPAIYWLSAQHPRPMGMGSEVSDDDTSRDDMAADTFIAERDAGERSESPSPSSLWRVFWSNPDRFTTMRRSSVSSGGEFRGALYPTPAGVEQESTIYPIPGKRGEPSHQPVLAATREPEESSSPAVDRRRQDTSVYPTPRVTTRRATPAPPLRRPSSIPTMASPTIHTGSQSACRDSQCLHGAANARLSSIVGAGGIQYDDDQTPSPARLADTGSDLSRRGASASSLFRYRVGSAPTAAPHTMAPVPTVAPAQIHGQSSSNPSPSTASTTSYPRPTPREGQAAAGYVAPGSAGSQGTTEKRNVSPTPRAQPPETVCMQYLSVQHDVDCGRRTRRSVPSTQHLALLLQHYGGAALSPFTAPTQHDADTKFRNLLPLGVPAADERIHMEFTSKQLLTQLENLYASKTHSKYFTSKRRSENETELISPYLADDHQLPPHFLEQMVPIQHVNLNRTAQRSRRSNHPHARTVRTVTANGYCQRASAHTTLTQDSRAHLCTQCQQTRQLGDDVFPTYIQEVVCYPDDAPCLNIGGSRGAQGQCQETYIPISVLRLNTGRCMRVNLPNGQSIVLDDWRLAQQVVRTGCQCMVDKRSPVAATLN